MEILADGSQYQPHAAESAINALFRRRTQHFEMVLTADTLIMVSVECISRRYGSMAMWLEIPLPDG